MKLCGGIGFLICALLALRAPALQAWPLDFLTDPAAKVLSEASFNMWNPGACSGAYNESAAVSELKQAAQCSPLTHGLTDQATALAAIGDQAQNSASDRYFALLAAQQSAELTCAADFARSIPHASPEKLAPLMAQLKALHMARSAMRAATEDLQRGGLVMCAYADQDYAAKAPADNTGYVDQQLERCRAMYKARIAYEAILNSIPLSNTPSVGKYLDDYGVMGSEAPGDLATAYKTAAADIQAKADSLMTAARQTGGTGFSRDDRYGMLQDPRIVAKVLGDHPSDDLKGVACQADAQFGKGADNLNTNLFIGGFVLGGGAMLAVKAGTAAAAVISSANMARSVGLISINAARVLQFTAVASEGLGAYTQVHANCTARLAPQSAAGSCVGAPKLEQLENDNCAIAASLAAIGFPGFTAVLAKGVKAMAPRQAVPTALLKTVDEAPAPPSYNGLSIRVSAAAEDTAALDKIKWLRRASINDTTEIIDPAFAAHADNAYIRYAIDPPNEIVSQPHLVIDMVRGDPRRKGVGQYLINQMIKDNPGLPIYSSLARKNGADFKKAFLDLNKLGTSPTREQVQAALSKVAAFRSAPGKVQIKLKYRDGDLEEVVLLREPDLESTTSVIGNLDDVMSDPQFQAWMDSLPGRPASYFNDTPEFLP